MKIVLVGGGSGGPVSPLLAVRDALLQRHPHAEFVFVGSRRGVERQIVNEIGLQYETVPAAKWRRYFSLLNLLTPFLLIFGFIKSLFLLRIYKPNVVFGAGSFLQVPVIWAAWVLRIPRVIHQQDLHPSLSNTLCAPVATRITVTFEGSVKDFPQGATLASFKKAAKVIWTGNPCRLQERELTKDEAVKQFKLDPTLPTIYVVGGGTGAAFINKLVWDSLDTLTRTVNVIHVTGPGKMQEQKNDHYAAFEFLKDVHPAYVASDIVVCRAGLSTITELSYLAKVAIVIPMPDSHQVLNARLLTIKYAAVVIQQEKVTPEKFVKLIQTLLFKKDARDAMARHVVELMPHNAATKIANILVDVSHTTL